MEQNGQISLSENSWINNRLCLELICDYFEPKTKYYLFSDYQILIFYKYAFSVLTKFI